MSAIEQRWTALYQAFNARQRLSETEKDLYVERPGAVAERIVRDLRLERQGKWVVCGSLGTGKSSELVHLGNMLWKDWMVIALDLPSSTARVDLLSPSEVLFLIGAAAVVRARLNGVQLEDALVNRLTSAFLGIVQPGVQLGGAAELIEGVALFLSNVATGGSAAAVGGATGAAKIVKGFLAGSTRAVREGEPQVQLLAEAVDNLFKRIREEKHLGEPIVLVDGLDKIQEMGPIRQLFTASRILTLPQVPIVYTGPITLMVSTYWNAASASFKQERLTNVVVNKAPPPWLNLSAEKIATGRQTMRSAIEKRLHRLQLKIEDVFEPAAVEELITNSGGVFRDLVRLVNSACRFALEAAEKDPAAKITSEVARQAIDDIRKELEASLTTKKIEEMKHVAQQGEPSGNDETSSELLLNNYVLPYQNGRLWFEPHPILKGARPGL